VGECGKPTASAVHRYQNNDETAKIENIIEKILLFKTDKSDNRT
jgi:hypothetical protein